jgi:hypothetical protein
MSIGISTVYEVGEGGSESGKVSGRRASDPCPTQQCHAARPNLHLRQDASQHVATGEHLSEVDQAGSLKPGLSGRPMNENRVEEHDLVSCWDAAW